MEEPLRDRPTLQGSLLDRAAWQHFILEKHVLDNPTPGELRHCPTLSGQHAVDVDTGRWAVAGYELSFKCWTVAERRHRAGSGADD